MNRIVILDIATTLHAVFCPHKHADDVLMILKEDTGLCNWYIESQCEEPWERDAHQIWYLKSAILVKTLKEAGKKEKDIIGFVNDTLKICRLLLDIRLINDDAERQLMEMLIEYYGDFA